MPSILITWIWHAKQGCYPADPCHSSVAVARLAALPPHGLAATPSACPATPAPPAPPVPPTPRPFAGRRGTGGGAAADWAGGSEVSLLGHLSASIPACTIH